MTITKEQQDLVNKAIIGLRKQGRQSITAGGSCAYRGPNGLKCAAGHALPDEEYDSSMEGQYASGIPFFVNEGVAGVMLKFQVIHDRIWDDGFPEIDYRRACEKFGYTYPEV